MPFTLADSLQRRQDRGQGQRKPHSIFYPRCWATLSVVFDDFTGPGGRPQLVDVAPTSASVHLTGYRSADTFTIEFDADRLPFSPEIIRACGVQIYMWDHPDTSADVRPFVSDESNLLIAGAVDDAELRYDTDGRRLHMTGRDYTAFFLDKEWPPTKALPLGKDLVQSVQDIVDDALRPPAGTNTERAQIKVVFAPEEPPPVTGSVRDPSITRKRQVKRPPLKSGKARKQSIPVHSGRSYWDVIYGLCAAYGYIAYLRLDKIIIRPGNSAGEIVDRAARVAYGRNLKSLVVTRKIGREVAPQVVTTAYDPETRSTVEARWPLEAPKRATGVGTVTEQVKRIPAPPGVTSKADLEAHCQAVYHAFGRHEAEIAWQTKTLQDLRGEDMLKLRPGEPMEIQFDAVKPEDFKELSPAQREGKMRELGYREDIARLVANHYEELERKHPYFYVRAISFDWDKDDGIQLGGTCLSYVDTARDDKPPVSGPVGSHASRGTEIEP